MHQYFKRTFSIEKLLHSIKKVHNVFWIALLNNVPVGYAKLKLHSPTPFIKTDLVSQLQKIYISKRYLGHGIGAVLQDQMTLRAQDHSSNHLWLSVLDSNEREIQFYLKNDFTKLGEHTFTIGQGVFDFDVMAKKL